MAVKITDLGDYTGGAFANTNEFECAVDLGGGVFASKKVSWSDFVASLPGGGGTNIGNSDLTISATGTRKLIMAGALGTDVFTIRNSADTSDLFTVAGNGQNTFNSSVLNGENFKWHYNGGKQMSLTTTTTAGILRVFDGATAVFDLDARTKATFTKPVDVTGSSIFKIATGGSGTFIVQDATTSTAKSKFTSTSGGIIQDWGNSSFNEVVRIDTRASQGALQIKTSGNTPTVIADGFKNYSKDIVAGNASPHWRTENGDILKLYKNTALTATDGTLATAIIRIGEIETILQNLGII